MGNAIFFYFPLPDARSLVTIDLGEGLGELFSEFEVDSSQAISRGGRRYLSNGLQREFVTIQRDRMIDGSTSAEEKAMRLQSMQNHLDRGGYVSFCSDADKAYMFPILNNIVQGTNELLCGSNPFKDVTGANLPAQNDFITIQTDSPTNIVEYKKIKFIDGAFNSTTGGEITTSPDLTYTYQQRAFMRYYRFWPCMRRDQRDIGQNIVTNENGRLFSLNVRLYHDTYSFFRFHPSFDGIDRSPNFRPQGVPAASGGSSGGSNPFVTAPGDHDMGPSGTSGSPAADIPPPENLQKTIGS